MIDEARRPFGTACVLAGGRGRRMEGRDKLFIELAGERLLKRIAGQLRPLFPDVVAVSSRPEAFAGLGYRVVPDGYEGVGPLAGLHAGLRASGSEWLYLVACDMPFFSAGWARELRLRAEADSPEGRPFAAFAARSGPYFEPFHALYHRSLIGAIEAAIAGAEASGKGSPSLQSLAGLGTVALVEPAIDPGPNLFLNLNTPRDVALAEGIASRI